MSASFRLVVAEKPSVARDIARALGLSGRGEGWIGDGELRVSWMLGHLLQLAEPAHYRPEWRAWSFEQLPMLPERFALVVRPEGREQWRTLRRLLRDPALSEVINACDAGREGELIFAYAYQHARCRAPVRRLWISAMTPEEIRRGFRELQPGERFAALEAAARCRDESDWLVGLNASRAATLRLRDRGGGSLLSLGRVQTPTLALLVRRDREIRDFVPRDYWRLRVRLHGESGTWLAEWEDPAVKEKDHPERIWERPRAEALAERLRLLGRGHVLEVTRREQSRPPPLLHDLTSLQREAHRRLGFTARRSLELAQALYERHKVLSYPRTDSRHLGTAQLPELRRLVEALEFGPYAEAARRVLAAAGDGPLDPGPRVVDDAEVSDHHAIVPTGVDPRPLGLSPDEKRLYDLVARRFLAVFHPPLRTATVKVVVAAGAERLVARGRSLLDPGWQAIEPPQKTRRDVLLPPVQEGEAVRLDEPELLHGRTEPPPPHTDDSLLGAMERAGEEVEDAELRRAMKRRGLGTPATRAAILETLLERGFARREGRSLLPTELGRALVEGLPGEPPAAALKSPRLTGEWEARLAAVAEGEARREDFMADIRAFVRELVEQLAAWEPPEELRRAARAAAPAETGAEPLGPCPVEGCDGLVYPQRSGWACSACDFRIPGQVAGRTISPTLARQLLRRGETRVVKGFRSRKGREFAAALRLVDGRVEFHFPAGEELGRCPLCGRPVRLRGSFYTCDTGRSCPFFLPREFRGREMSPEEVRLLLERGRTPRLEGFVSRSGSRFKAAVVLRDGRPALDYSKPPPPRPRVPPDGPPPAFDPPLACPRCAAREEPEPGYLLVRGRSWACSRGEACGFALPFEVEGLLLPEAEARRLLGPLGRTHCMSGLGGPERRAWQQRLHLRPLQDPPWELEPCGRRPKGKK